MDKKTKVALIGLDTSHTVAFADIMQSPELDDSQKVHSLQATSCLRFETPFQDKAGLDERQAHLEKLGIEVTEDFDRAVADCDVIMLEINDPTYHLEYFKKVSELGKPIYIDKPLADSLDNGLEIIQIAKEKKLRVMSASPLRFDLDMVEAAHKMPKPDFAISWGNLGIAPAGSSIIWYGVHAFEMLQLSMGSGATLITAIPDRMGCSFHVDYADGRRGMVFLNYVKYLPKYGGVMRKSNTPDVTYSCNRFSYLPTLQAAEKFFLGETPSVTLEDALEIMSMLESADRSFRSGKSEIVYQK